VPYLLANAASTGVLAVIAVIEVQPGFVLTNGVWAALSAVGLVRLARGERGSAEAAPYGATGPDSR
jgi:hypothetical protein